MDQVTQLEWDCDHALVTLKITHISHALQKYLQDSLSEQEIEKWASLIENREDIAIDEKNDDLINSYIYELANPMLTTPLTKERANNLLKNIKIN